MHPPSYIKRVRETYGKDFRICTVIDSRWDIIQDIKVRGDSAGYSKTVPDEIDTVINMGTKNGDFDLVRSELKKAIRKLLGEKILKVIIETMLFNDGWKNGKCAVS